jgi:hypothetical protein
LSNPKAFKISATALKTRPIAPLMITATLVATFLISIPVNRLNPYNNSSINSATGSIIIFVRYVAALSINLFTFPIVSHTLSNF